MNSRVSRRHILSSVGLLAGTSLLAACGGSSVTAALSSASALAVGTTATTAASSSKAAVASTVSTAASASSATSVVATTSVAVTTTAPATTASVAAASGAGVTLQYLGQGSKQEQQIYHTLADNFHQANPGITIQVGFSTKGGAAGILEQLETMVAAGSGPDVYWTHSWIGSGLYKKGVSLVLDPFLNQDKSIKLDDYYQAAYLDYTFDGKHTALPREIATDVIFYRTDLFDKAGIKYPDAKWTWSDLRDKAKQLTSTQGGTTVFGYGGPVTSIFLYTSMALENGSDIIDRQNMKSLFPSQPVVEAIQYLADFRFKDHSAATPADLKADKSAGSFSDGKSAIAFSGYYTISTITGKKPSWSYDVSNMPVNASGKRVSASATSAHSAWSGTNHAQESWQWLKYLSGEQASTLYGQTGLVIPPLKAVAESATFTSASSEPHHRKVFIDDLAAGHAFPIVPNWIDVLDAIDSMLSPVWAGTKTAKEAIDAGNAKVDALLQQNK